MISPKATQQERRQYPRIAKNIPIKIFQEDGDIVTETGNISRSGVYCRVNRRIEPMTKLKINLLFPLRKNGKNLTKKISCQGVVVRTEAIHGEDSFYIAVFFNDITQRDADTIADYISSSLQQETQTLK